MAKVSNDSISLKVYYLEGMDRISSSVSLETESENIRAFPFVKTPVELALNVTDNIPGTLEKRGGSTPLLSSALGTQITTLMDFTNASGAGIHQWVIQAGTSLYATVPEPTSLGSSIKTLTGSGMMGSARLNGYLYMGNGVDTFMYYDGSNIRNIANNAFSTTTSNPVGVTDTTVSVSSTAAFDPNGGFFQIDSETIQYFTLDGNHFLNCVRGYGGTTATTHAVSAPVNVYYGSPPVTPNIVVQWEGRIYTASHGSVLTWSGVHNKITDGQDYNVNSLDTGSSGSTFIDPDNSSQITNLQVSGGQLVVTKTASTYLITPDQYGRPSSIVKVNNNYGSIVTNSAVTVDSTVLWYSAIGPYIWDGRKSYWISFQVSDLAQGATNPGPSGSHNFWIYFTLGSTSESLRFTGETYNNAVLAYNYITEKWFMFTFPFAITAMNEMKSAINEPQLYYADNTGQIYRYLDPTDPDNNYSTNAFADNGIAIPAKVRTRYFFMKEPNKTKEFLQVSALCEGGVNGVLNYSLTGVFQTDYNFAMPLPNLANRTRIPTLNTNFRGISFLVVESSTGRFALNGFEQEFQFTGGN